MSSVRAYEDRLLHRDSAPSGLLDTVAWEKTQCNHHDGALGNVAGSSIRMPPSMISTLYVTPSMTSTLNTTPSMTSTLYMMTSTLNTTPMTSALYLTLP